jgi:hypothetical protein
MRPPAGDWMAGAYRRRGPRNRRSLQRAYQFDSPDAP